MQENAKHEQSADPLCGKVIHGRYRITELSEEDDCSRLYRGIDDETGALIGVWIASNAEAHQRFQDWLKPAITSRGKDAILAVGHVGRWQSYVVLCEAGLNLPPRAVPKEEDNDHEESIEDRIHKKFASLLKLGFFHKKNNE